jgi:hypothetical protein
MMRWLQSSPLTPWTGLFVGAFAWFLHHQAGSDGVNFDCRAAGSAYVVGLGLVCALMALAGGWVSWSTKPAEPIEAQQTRRFARIVGLAGAAVFLMAIGIQTLAGALVPPCLR